MLIQEFSVEDSDYSPYTLHMTTNKKEHPKEKTNMHARNKHRERYDFKVLIESCPELAPYVKLNAYNDLSIDFFDPKAVLVLNKALLKHYYDIIYWAIPPNYLCPPIPGRADYIHYVADLLGASNRGKIPRGDKIKCLDIGVGANCVYPIIGNKEYGWSFIGTDTDALAIEAASQIIDLNPILKDKVELRLQDNPKDVFAGILVEGERIDVTICNPPFHASLAEARSGSLRKLKNLTGKAKAVPLLNFGGQNNELWCEGGEAEFLRVMIQQSKQYDDCCFWFSSLVSKRDTLEGIYKQLEKLKAVEIKTIAMGQGNKLSRIVAWTFLSEEQQKGWSDARWG